MRIRIVAVMMGLVLLSSNLVAQGLELKQVASKFDITLYGYVKLDASYDTQRTSAGDLMFFVLPEVNGEKDNEFNMTAKETRFGFDISGPASDTVKTTGKIEGDFYGPGGSANSPNLRLRLAYLDLALNNGLSFRAGQDWETFITVIPKIVNFSYLADCGALGLRRPQARLTYEAGGDTKFIGKLAVARTIGEDIDGGGQDDGVDSGLPTVQYNFVIQTKWLSSKPTKLGISGHYGQETLDGVTTNTPPRISTVDDKNYDTWSVIGSAIIPLHDKVALQGTLWMGENLDTYFGGIGQGINKALATEIAAKGGFFQAMFDVTSRLNLNVGVGADDPEDDDLNANGRSLNKMGFASAFFSLTPAATLAVEYSHMITSYKGSDDATNDRFQGAAIYKF
ncbi:MAG TPA: hypothetical protein DCZ95_16825 [Verrucomicrobia bacterium]|nr:MAG: hypothetical protein A2X46_09315 [Lentisphaerae bacterium GWF2_57_35]HBA85748.1 hypothetical protein [Verrucomicrobiota bacterium]